MKRGLSVALGLVACGVASVATAHADGDAVGTCIRVRAEARYRGLGYNHIVHVADVCAADADCDVSTDVNPQPTHVLIAGKSEIEVTTFLGSPARVFIPKVECTLKK